MLSGRVVVRFQWSESGRWADMIVTGRLRTDVLHRPVEIAAEGRPIRLKTFVSISGDRLISPATANIEVSLGISLGDAEMLGRELQAGIMLQ